MLVAVQISLATAAFLTEMCPLGSPTRSGRHRSDHRRTQHRDRAVEPLRPATRLLPRRRALHAEDPSGQAPLPGRRRGPGLFLTGFVLAIMIVPTMVALSRTALASMGNPDREASRGAGRPPWQVIRNVVVPAPTRGSWPPPPWPSAGTRRDDRRHLSHRQLDPHLASVLALEPRGRPRFDHRVRLRRVGPRHVAPPLAPGPRSDAPGHHARGQYQRTPHRPQEPAVPAAVSTDLLEAPAPSPSGKNPAAADGGCLIQSSARRRSSGDDQWPCPSASYSGPPRSSH